ICSLKELSVQDKFIPDQYRVGIIVLPDDAVIGEAVDALLNLDDTILEFDLTLNRPDALNMIRVAYEVCTILDIEIHLLNYSYAVVGEAVDVLLKLVDTFLEFDLPLNRADVLNMIGVAYEVGAILYTEIHLPNTSYAINDEHISDYMEIKVDDKDACPYYGAF